MRRRANISDSSAALLEPTLLPDQMAIARGVSGEKRSHRTTHRTFPLRESATNDDSPVPVTSRCYTRSCILTVVTWIMRQTTAWIVRLGIILALAFSASCFGGKETTPPPVSQTGTPKPSASAYEVAQAYLTSWSQFRFSDMYDLLSPPAKQTITRERFIARYQGIADEATMTGIAIEFQKPNDINVTPLSFIATVRTSLWGDITDPNSLPMSRSDEGWRVDWTPALIFSRLTGGNLVRRFVEAQRRGAILDRSGRPLAITADVPLIGTAKSLLNNPQIVANREAWLRDTATKLSLPVDEIRKKVDDPKVGDDLFIPLKTLTVQVTDPSVRQFDDAPAILIQRKPRRFYPLGPAAAHVIGYVAPITAEQFEKLKEKGYEIDDMVGGIGLEAEQETVLAGERAARLTVITPEGSVVQELARRPSKPAYDIITTLDAEVQQTAAAALGQLPGALVSIDPRDRGVIAMVSYPTFDPNLFVTGLPATVAEKLFSDKQRPLLNRAIDAVYAPGSTFKVFTGALGLERGGYTAQSRFACPPTWYGLGIPMNNWSKVNEGQLTIAEGLMRSCNPVFFDIMVRMDGISPSSLPDFAAAFGFGKPTGLIGLEDSTGTNPTPEWKKKTIGEGWFTGDSVNMAIGQGYLTVTPLQLANAYVTLTSDLVLRTPVLVRELREAGKPTVAQHFDAQELGRAPVSPATQATIKEGTRLVTQDPRGTGFGAYGGSRIDAGGKSGTAEDVGTNDHALFAAYAPRPAPKGVAIAVLDSGKSGSIEAAPMTRQVLEKWLSVAP